MKEFGLTYFGMDDKRQGIVHIIGPENGFTLPGSTVVCGDRSVPPAVHLPCESRQLRPASASPPLRGPARAAQPRMLCSRDPPFNSFQPLAAARLHPPYHMIHCTLPLPAK